ncbi:hypothetical protein LZ31DRAFT_307564 [Colletotrichum somersetense]|nr:hypothetical protein LZ31DRAFT_307564 [Colletotrichum somersetense]
MDRGMGNNAEAKRARRRLSDPVLWERLAQDRRHPRRERRRVSGVASSCAMARPSRCRPGHPGKQERRARRKDVSQIMEVGESGAAMASFARGEGRQTERRLFERGVTGKRHVVQGGYCVCQRSLDSGIVCYVQYSVVRYTSTGHSTGMGELAYEYTCICTRSSA